MPALRLPRTAPFIALLAVALLPAACAKRSVLAPLEPDRAKAELEAAEQAFSREPSSTMRLRLGKVQYRAGAYAAARATLAPLRDQPGPIGADAALFDAAAADRLGDRSAARQGYSRYLAQHDDPAVRARLAAIARAEADSAAKAAIAAERSLDPATLPARSVGVAPLFVAGDDTALAPLGYGLADLLITDLARSAQLEVVDRVRVDALLQELHLAGSGRVDSTSAPRVGKLVGARRLVNGGLMRGPGSGIVITARVADAAQGTLVGQPITARTSLSDLLDAEKALAFRLFDALGVTLTPAERAAVEQRPTRYLAAFLAYSRGVRAEALGDLVAARAYYEDALAIDPGFRLASLRHVGVGLPTSQSSSGPGARIPPRVVSGVVQALNPSPAAALGAVRERGDANVQAMLQHGSSATIIINILIP